MNGVVEKIAGGARKPYFFIRGEDGKKYFGHSREVVNSNNHKRYCYVSNNVTFEPGCRNNYHIHHATKGGGQILICVEGEGWFKEEGKEVVSLKPGDVVTIPANVSKIPRKFTLFVRKSISFSQRPMTSRSRI